ncbi:matrix remodeling associated 7 [Ictidomys tridecemlineatus]|nr:matrix remodeling associated 7 [Ictidomys tridecemlineatus]
MPVAKHKWETHTSSNLAVNQGIRDPLLGPVLFHIRPLGFQLPPAPWPMARLLDLVTLDLEPLPPSSVHPLPPFPKAAIWPHPPGHSSLESVHTPQELAIAPSLPVALAPALVLQEEEQHSDSEKDPPPAGPEDEDGETFSFKYSPGQLRGNQYKKMMTKEELEEEQRVQKEQLAAIFKLMKDNKETFGEMSDGDVQEQLRLYDM